MNNSFAQYMYSVLRQVMQECRQRSYQIGKVLANTPLPRVLVVLVAIALLISLIPFLLCLFAGFILLKWVFGMMQMPAQQTRHPSEMQRQRIYVRRFPRND